MLKVSALECARGVFVLQSKIERPGGSFAVARLLLFRC
jgi:hypothetical protein